MNKVKYIALLLCTMFALEGMAQTAKSAYFLDGTFHNYKLNPAMDAERAFFSIGLGNMTIGTNGNVGISHFLYPQGDHLTTFMSGAVDQDLFLDRLPQTIQGGLNYDASLLAFGFRLLGGYTSFSLSVHSSTSIALPQSIFKFAKKGFQESQYSFSGINMNTTNYAAATLGYSYEVYKGLRVGVNLKYLMGLAYGDVTFNTLDIEMSEERWRMETYAQGHAALFGEVYFNGNDNNLNELRMGSFAPTANGFAVDLGVEYDMDEFVPGLTVSASVLDLGFIHWRHMMSLNNSHTLPIEWTGISGTDINDIGTAIESEIERLGDHAMSLFELQVHDIKPSKTNLNATMYLGAEYEMPFYQPLSVAMLYGKKFSRYNGWDEVRGYINVAPLKWFEASANVGYTTYGTSLGWMLNFHPVGASFFIGSDYMVTRVSPQFIPINNLNYHLTFGVNVPLGARK